jgi:hypothetical protein
MKKLFDYGEHCALAGELWSTPIDALDQGPSRGLLATADAVPCAGSSLAPVATPVVAIPKMAISKEIEAALPDARPGALLPAGH